MSSHWIKFPVERLEGEENKKEEYTHKLPEKIEDEILRVDLHYHQPQLFISEDELKYSSARLYVVRDLMVAASWGSSDFRLISGLLGLPVALTACSEREQKQEKYL